MTPEHVPAHFSDLAQSVPQTFMAWFLFISLVELGSCAFDNPC
jgi:hypothetical protein